MQLRRGTKFGRTSLTTRGADRTVMAAWPSSQTPRRVAGLLVKELSRRRRPLLSFSAFRRVANIASPRRSTFATLTWLDDSGHKVEEDPSGGGELLGGHAADRRNGISRERSGRCSRVVRSARDLQGTR